MSTNGRRFAQSLNFTKQFAEVAKKGNTRIHIDISGGYNDDYNQILYVDVILNKNVIDEETD